MSVTVALGTFPYKFVPSLSLSPIPRLTLALRRGCRSSLWQNHYSQYSRDVKRRQNNSRGFHILVKTEIFKSSGIFHEYGRVWHPVTFVRHWRHKSYTVKKKTVKKSFV